MAWEWSRGLDGPLLSVCGYVGWTPGVAVGGWLGCTTAGHRGEAHWVFACKFSKAGLHCARLARSCAISSRSVRSVQLSHASQLIRQMATSRVKVKKGVDMVEGANYQA